MKKIYVGNLPYQATEEELESVFGDYGAVLSVSIIRDRQTGRSRGFGFVEMENEADAQKAIEGLNGHELGDRSLVVNEARERSPSRGDRGGFRGGG